MNHHILIGSQLWSNEGQTDRWWKCSIQDWQLRDFFEPIKMQWFIKEPINLLHFVLTIGYIKWVFQVFISSLHIKIDSMSVTDSAITLSANFLFLPHYFWLHIRSTTEQMYVNMLTVLNIKITLKIMLLPSMQLIWLQRKLNLDLSN